MFHPKRINFGILIQVVRITNMQKCKIPRKYFAPKYVDLHLSTASLKNADKKNVGICKSQTIITLRLWKFMLQKITQFIFHYVKIRFN